MATSTSVRFIHVSPSLVHIIEEDNMIVKQEKTDKVHIIEEESMVVKQEKTDKNCIFDNQKTRNPQDGTRNQPIVVNSVGNGSNGSRNDPISLEDETEVIGDSHNPIAVDDYETENILIQFAVNESLLEVECFEVDPNDPKGKKPKRERRRVSIREVGESSNPPPFKPDAYCYICLEPKFKNDCIAMKNCTHLYCSSCVSQYVEAKIEDNVTSIGCPDPACQDGCLELEMCRLILKPEIFNRWGDALCEAIIGAMKFYCPFKDCSALLIDERINGGELIAQSECPHCFRLFCAQCKVPWHTEVSCEEFARLGADERGREDIMLKKLAEKSNWQRCPKCNFYVERISGCMFIKCRCGHQFCYGCAEPMLIDHYCAKCRR